MEILLTPNGAYNNMHACVPSHIRTRKPTAKRQNSWLQTTYVDITEANKEVYKATENSYCKYFISG